MSTLETSVAGSTCADAVKGESSSAAAQASETSGAERRRGRGMRAFRERSITGLAASIATRAGAATYLGKGDEAAVNGVRNFGIAWERAPTSSMLAPVT